MKIKLLMILLASFVSQISFAGRSHWFVCVGGGIMENIELGGRSFVLQHGYYKTGIKEDGSDYKWRAKFEMRLCHDRFDVESCQIYVDDVGPDQDNEDQGYQVKLVNKEDKSDVLFTGRIVDFANEQKIEGLMEDRMNGQQQFNFKGSFQCYEMPWLEL